MKKTTNFLFLIELEGMELEQIDSILFKFQQGARTLTFAYPSGNAFRLGDENKIALRWTIDDTQRFDPHRKIEMDSFIRVKDSDENPYTEILSFEMSRSLFTPEEVSADG